MPIIEVLGKKILTPNFEYKNIYWPILTKLVEDKIGSREVKEPKEVEEILKECFSNLCNIFSNKLEEQNTAAFYLYCHYLHEDSVELWKAQLRGVNLNLNSDDFSSFRRVLKIILEQSCKLNLKGSLNFAKQIEDNTNNYTTKLEELFYLGYWCIILSEYIARSQLFPTSIGLRIEESELSILTYEPYNSLYKFTSGEIPKHNSDVAVANPIKDFIGILETELKVDYKVLSEFLEYQISQPENRYKILKIENLIDILIRDFNYDRTFLVDFYKGLTISKANVLNVEICILRNQDINRYTYRPILEWNIDGEVCNVVGYQKWLESFTTLTNNAFPFAVYPLEWQKYSAIKKFVLDLDRNHDKILEDPIRSLLHVSKIKFDSSITSFKQLSGNNINIEFTIGDFDILFLDEKSQLIYIGECKHNRARFDMNNWKRDYFNFKDKYEAQLEKKVEWAKRNKKIIQEHFECIYGNEFKIQLEKFDIIGIFIINAPSFYMFNGKYRAFTIKDFKDLLKGVYEDIILDMLNPTTGERYVVTYPYFDNLAYQLNK